jgi:hypothetical protein
MKSLDRYAGQNWLITPAALVVGQPPPASIHEQRWLLVLSGVVFADFKGNSSATWLRDVLYFSPDMAGPLNWAISRFSIPKPPGSPTNYNIVFSVEEWAPFVSLSSIFNQNQSINSGFAVDRWKAHQFESGTDVLSNLPVNNIFTGIDVDAAVRDTDAWIYRLGYNVTLLGKIAFTGAVIL